MGVAAHLNISLEEYDSRIRSFIPQYETMIASAAEALQILDAPSPLIVDLGIGTGTLARACLDARPDARVYGIDEDPAMLDVARQRLRDTSRATFGQGSFLDLTLPACDAIVASFALHHVRTATQKRALYSSCRRALGAGGLLISADSVMASDPALASLQREAWLAHLRRTYTPEEAGAYLAAWAREDVYFSLAEECDMLRSAGFSADVVWRAGSFAVLSARAV